jgi:hypothetical protein
MRLLWWKPQRPSGLRADIGDVLLDELTGILHRRRIMRRGGAGPLTIRLTHNAQSSAQSKLDRYYKRAHRIGDLSALCLSGGGIRSAAFALGVIQGLVAKGILTKFDYLSTVSGGGYLGSFLTTWVQREGFGSVLTELQGGPRLKGSSPLQQLRRYSSYLAPRKGLLTGDALTVGSLYVRNLLLNWLIIIPLITLAVVLAKFFAFFAWISPSHPSVIAPLAIISILCIGLATLDSLRQRPGWENVRSTRRKFQWNELAPMLLGGILASCGALKYLEQHFDAPSAWNLILPLAVIGVCIAFISWMIAFFIAPPAPLNEVSTRKTVHSDGLLALGTLASFTASGAVLGAWLGIAIYCMAQVADPNVRAFVLLCFGPPLLIIAQFISELLHVGFTSYMPWGDAEREWLARAAGYHSRAAASWAAVTLVVFGGSYLTFELYNRGIGALSSVASSGTLAGIITALVAKWSATGAVIKERQDVLRQGTKESRGKKAEEAAAQLADETNEGFWLLETLDILEAAEERQHDDAKMITRKRRTKDKPEPPEEQHHINWLERDALWFKPFCCSIPTGHSHPSQWRGRC